MKHFFGKTMSFLLISLLGYSFLTAQELELPAKSPLASLSYTMGYTKISIEYSSPAVREREVWGNLVPYDKIWRAGANKATTIEFSTPVFVGKERAELAAGKYSFFVIPKAEGNWQVIFNKVHDQWGTYNYDENEDAARIEVKPRFAGSAERLSYEIVDQGLGRGYMLLSWADLKLVVFISTSAYDDLKLAVEEALTNADDATASNINAQAADVLIDLDDKRADAALDYINASIEKGETPYNHWVKAKILAVQGDKDGAIQAAKKALELGQANPEDRFFKNYQGTIERGIARWSK